MAKTRAKPDKRERVVPAAMIIALRPDEVPEASTPRGGAGAARAPLELGAPVAVPAVVDAPPACIGPGRSTGVGRSTGIGGYKALP